MIFSEVEKIMADNHLFLINYDGVVGFYATGDGDDCFLIVLCSKNISESSLSSVLKCRVFCHLLGTIDAGLAEDAEGVKVFFCN